MSNTNYTLTLQCKATYKGQEIEFSFDPYNDCTTIDSLIEMAQLEIETSDDFEVEADGIETDEIKVNIIDFDDVPDKWANEADVWEFAEAFAECEQDVDVVEAALECGVSASDIDEAYQGSYDDDEDFAQETAESMGAVDKNANWPMNCIDWEYAARELMHDYSEHKGHYFRSL